MPTLLGAQSSTFDLETIPGIGSGGGGGASAGFDGRLTLVSGVPDSQDDATSATLYVTPYKGNRAEVYNGSAWVTVEFTQQTVDLSGYASEDAIDLFGVLDGGALTIAVGAWTDKNTRANSLAWFEGRLVLDSDHTLLYLGSVYIRDEGLAYDTAQYRDVQSFHHPIEKRIALPIILTTHTYDGTSFRVFDDDVTNRVWWFTGWLNNVVRMTARCLRILSVYGANVGMKLNSTVGADYDNGGAFNGTVEVTATFKPVLGINYITLTEYTEGTSTTFGYGFLEGLIKC